MLRPKKILYVNENQSIQIQALKNAVKLAKINQSTLTVLSVLPESYLQIDYRLSSRGAVSEEYKELILKEERKKIDELIGEYVKELDIDVKIVIGTKFIEVIKEVLENEYDFVIKAAENPSWLERQFGSDDMHLLRKCPVPLWIVKDSQNESDYEFKHILAAVDFDIYSEDNTNKDLNFKIKDIAASFAQANSSVLHLVHAWEPAFEMLLRRYGTNPLLKSFDNENEEQTLREQSMDSLKQELLGVEDKSFKTIPHIFKQQTIEAIAQTVDKYDIDLVIMGTVGRTGIEGYFMGNTAESILDQLQCSVIAVKPEGFETPIKIDK